VPWDGSIIVSPDGRTLHGIVPCGGTLEIISQTADRVEVRLRVGALGPGVMTCARVDVAVQLDGPLDGRPVYDAVTGQTLTVVSG